jgi:hypothetical protein
MTSVDGGGYCITTNYVIDASYSSHYSQSSGKKKVEMRSTCSFNGGDKKCIENFGGQTC